MPASTLTRLDKLHALVVDDDESSRMFLKLALARQGARVEVVNGGCAALQALMQHEYDLLVVDMHMPDMNGEVLIEEVRQLMPWLPVIVYSGFLDPQRRQAMAALGVCRVLDKTFQPEQLIAAVADHCAAAPAQRPAAMLLTQDEMQRHYRGLRHLTETALAAANDHEAFRRLTVGLGRMFPCRVAGFLRVDGQRQNLVLSVLERVSSRFVEAMRQQLINRFERLSATTLEPGHLLVQIDGDQVAGEGAPELEQLVSVPVIVSERLQGILAIAAAAEDQRPHSLSLLYHAADHFAMVFSALQRLQQQASRDSLTALYNRLYFQEELERAWQRHQRYGQPLDVVIVDVDHFKAINDTYGHVVGDRVLCELAAVLETQVRRSDTLARYGGEEFVIVLGNADETTGQGFAQRIRDEISKHTFCARRHNLRLTVSVGVVSTRNSRTSCDNATEFLNRADRALYLAKRKGRNQVRWWCDIERQALETLAAKPAATPVVAEPADKLSLPNRGRVLLVDDDSQVQQVVRLSLEQGGYEVVLCHCAAEALATLGRQADELDVVIADVRLPDASGITLLQELVKIDDTIAKVMITGNATVENAIECLRLGAYDFIEKPIVGEHLLAVVKRALEYRTTLLENRRYQVFLEQLVRQKSQDLSQSLDEIKISYDFTLEALMGLLDARERGSGKHSQRVRRMTMILAGHMGFEHEFLETCGHGALLHDIGKIGIPDPILLKPGPLTPMERSIIQRHSEIGYRILRSSSWLCGAAEIVHAHHEWFNGKGYPRGLRGDQICAGARIFALVDAYDTMRKGRHYRQALSHEQTTEEIHRFCGSQFDPRVVDVFLDCVHELETVLAES